jgi:hypothetical protein
VQGLQLWAQEMQQQQAACLQQLQQLLQLQPSELHALLLLHPGLQPL